MRYLQLLESNPTVFDSKLSFRMFMRCEQSRPASLLKLQLEPFWGF